LRDINSNVLTTVGSRLNPDVHKKPVTIQPFSVREPSKKNVYRTEMQRRKEDQNHSFCGIVFLIITNPLISTALIEPEGDFFAVVAKH